MCIFTFVHAENTTGRDAAARRRHRYASRCAQCRKPLGPTDRVAAHVVAYPCGNGLCGLLTLRTSCKRCNARGRPYVGVVARRWPRCLRVVCCWPSCLAWYPGPIADHRPVCRATHAPGAEER